MFTFDDPLENAFCLIVTGGVLILRGLRRLRKLRLMQDTPCSEIRSAPQGLVEIEGHALPYLNEYQNSDGKKVVYHSLKIERLISRGKSSEWVTLYERTHGGTFVVSDGTGIALVKVAKADLVFEKLTREWSKIPEAEQITLIARYGSKVSELKSGKPGFFSVRSRYQIVESSLLVGAPVYIRGSFRTSDEKTAYTISPLHLRFLEKLARLKEAPTGRAKAFDLNRDGKIDEFELDKGSEKLLYQSRHAVIPEDRAESVAIQGTFENDGIHGLTIGASHQIHLAKKLSTWNGLRIVGGAILVAAGVAVAVTHLI